MSRYYVSGLLDNRIHIYHGNIGMAKEIEQLSHVQKCTEPAYNPGGYLIDTKPGIDLGDAATQVYKLLDGAQ